MDPCHSFQWDFCLAQEAKFEATKSSPPDEAELGWCEQTNNLDLNLKKLQLKCHTPSLVE